MSTHTLVSEPLRPLEVRVTSYRRIFGLFEATQLVAPSETPKPGNDATKHYELSSRIVWSLTCEGTLFQVQCVPLPRLSDGLGTTPRNKRRAGAETQPFSAETVGVHAQLTMGIFLTRRMHLPMKVASASSSPRFNSWSHLSVISSISEIR